MISTNGMLVKNKKRTRVIVILKRGHLEQFTLETTLFENMKMQSVPLN